MIGVIMWVFGPIQGVSFDGRDLLSICGCAFGIVCAYYWLKIFFRRRPK